MQRKGIGCLEEGSKTRCSQSFRRGAAQLPKEHGEMQMARENLELCDETFRLQLGEN